MKMWLQQNRKFVAFAALVAIGLFLFTTRNPSPPEPAIPPVTSALPTETDKNDSEIVRTGVIENATLLPIHSGFAGKIVEVYVKNGQQVQAGQALFKLEYSMSPVTNASASTGTKKVDSERLKKLYEQGIISRREWETATGAQAPSPKNESESPSPATMPGRISLATANAPIAGIITGLTVDAENTVQADQRILSIGGGSKLEAVVSLAQDELYKVPLGAPAMIEISGHSIPSTVISILPELKENIVVSFQARIPIDGAEANEALQAGVSATIHIRTMP